MVIQRTFSLFYWTRHKLVALRTNKKYSVALVREQTIPTERSPLVGEVSSNFCGLGCHVVSVTDPYDCILAFLDRSSYFFFQVVPQLYSRGWMDPVPDPLPLRKYGSPGVEAGTPDLSPGTLATRPQRRSFEQTGGKNMVLWCHVAEAVLTNKRQSSITF
jgi:hypothetical protein